MKVIAAIAIILSSSSALFAAQQPGYWSSGMHHIKMSITTTTSKSIHGIRTVLHLDSKKSK